MKFRTAIAAAFAVALSWTQAFGQATLLPAGENCFQATTGINGMVGLLGSITGGSLYTNGTYGGVSLTGGSGSGATANITVSGGIVTAVTILNPGTQYVVGDVLTAPSASIGGSGSGFSVPVASTAINSSLAGGTVGFYIPNTNTFKQTWTDAGESTLNQNPVQLDGNGCAVIYGAGIYRQILKDNLGNTVWDKLTASTSPVGVFWAGQAGGTGNAITITDASFSAQDGQTIQFLALLANTGPTTVSVSGGQTYAIVSDSSTGPVSLSGGEIGPGNTPIITFDATAQEFHIVNPAATSSSGGATSTLTPPQGYLNLVGQASGDVVQTGDVVAAVTIFYSPYVGNTIPIWNGSAFKTLVFSELTATLTASGSASGVIQDECVFSNNGVPTLVTGPAWTTAAAGAGSRGTGAGTAQITRVQGIWVNANSIVGYSGLTSYTIPASQCTYVGSVSVDAAAGQVSAFRTLGQSRKFGVWNAYNRQQIIMQASDPVSSWTYNTGTFRPSNNNTANSITTFTGLPEEQIEADFNQQVSGGSATGTTQVVAQWTIGIGWNSTTAPSGQRGTGGFRIDGTGIDFQLQSTTPAKYINPPSLGVNVTTSLEATPSIGGSATVTYQGSSSMILTAKYRG